MMLIWNADLGHGSWKEVGASTQRWTSVGTSTVPAAAVVARSAFAGPALLPIDVEGCTVRPSRW